MKTFMFILNQVKNPTPTQRVHNLIDAIRELQIEIGFCTSEQRFQFESELIELREELQRLKEQLDSAYLSSHDEVAADLLCDIEDFESYFQRQEEEAVLTAYFDSFENKKLPF